MNIIKRELQNIIENRLFKGKIIIIYGARQVGKTTLIREIQKKYPTDSVYINCDEPDNRAALTNKTSAELRAFIGPKRLVLIDEAQRVKNIGLSLKLLVDNYPQTQIIATGSSSFDLANKISEPLTGRKFEYLLQPFSLKELLIGQDLLTIKRTLDQRIICGSYPEIAGLGFADSQAALKNLVQGYLYKDVLEYDNIKNPEKLEGLLQALALQIGNEVSYSELAALIDLNPKTVISYLATLEKAFVIFRLRPYSRNLRNEIKKLRKIYFYDTGIRNALINNFNPLKLRNDAGLLWENFLISERFKNNSNRERNVNAYFWRSPQAGEIDYLEEADGAISAFEFKLNKNKFKPPKKFLENYPACPIKLIFRENAEEFWNS
jgi:predicted AAA+ superfamily ATPase